MHFDLDAIRCEAELSPLVEAFQERVGQCKRCTGCQVVKPFSDFHVHSMGRHGRRSRCKACQRKANRPWEQANGERIREYGRRWRKDNPEKLAASQEKFIETPQGRAKILWYAAKQRRPEDFTLTKAHVIEGISRGFCPRTGFPFDLSARYRSRSDKSRNPLAPSLDRLDGSKGYTDDNVEVVCSQFNIMRGELSLEELLPFCRAVLEQAA